MKITEVKYYGGSLERITKLGLTNLYLEVQNILLETTVTIAEERDANGAAAIRKMVDKGFETKGDWEKKSSGGIDWSKRFKYNRTLIASIGVEVQLSARSDLIIRDLVHLRKAIQEGEIEVGVVVVPSDLLQKFLPDRTPSLRDAIRMFEDEFPEAKTFPIVLIAVEHDGVGSAIPKQRRKA